MKQNEHVLMRCPRRAFRISQDGPRRRGCRRVGERASREDQDRKERHLIFHEPHLQQIVALFDAAQRPFAILEILFIISKKHFANGTQCYLPRSV